ncbi:MAG TPA: class I SAM-dependent methyltransferase [Thermoleophilaceae bacterium]|nr:class I SAM-dependent methyltransferase [Thermoleophilaceae bacterium]
MSYAPERYWTDLHREQREKLSAVGWPALGEGFNRETYKLRLDAARDVLSSARPGSLLEAAVGVGAYAPLWADLGVGRWTGLDISPEAVADLERRFPQSTFLTADLADAGFASKLEEGGFDLVTAIDVLFHLTDDAQFAAALRNLAGQVRAGGLLVVTGVFLGSANQTAGHVRHRPLAAHGEAIGPAFELVTRRPVFAILDEAVPVTAKGRALNVAWKLLSGILRVAPASVRDRLGALMVRALRPLDAALRPLAAGANLELAVYRRRPE